VGRFIYQAQRANAQKFVDIIEQECKGAVTIPKIRRSIFMINSYCCCFYSVFLFDTLGDTEGFDKSYWVFLTLPLFPVVLYIGHHVRRHMPFYMIPTFISEEKGDDDSVMSVKSVEMSGEGVTVCANPIHSAKEHDAL